MHVRSTPKAMTRKIKSSSYAVQSFGVATLWLASTLPILASPLGLREPAVSTVGANPKPQSQQTNSGSPRYDPDLYVLGPGDQLQMVFVDPSASGIGSSFRILNDGTATLNLLGSVQLTGLTIGQANRWLTSLYSKQLLRPNLYQIGRAHV